MIKGCRTCYWTGYQYRTIDGKRYVRVPHHCQQVPR